MDRRTEREYEIDRTDRKIEIDPPTYEEATLIESGHLSPFPPRYFDLFEEDPYSRLMIFDYDDDRGDRNDRDDLLNGAVLGEVNICGSSYFDLHGICALIVYYIPTYLLGPVIYSSVLEHIADAWMKESVWLGEWRILDLPVRFGYLSIYLYVITISSLFLIGKFSYSWIFFGKLRMKSDFSVLTAIFVLIIQVNAVKLSYDGWRMAVSLLGLDKNVFLYIKYLSLLAVYLLIKIGMIRNIYNCLVKWDAEYFRRRLYFLEKWNKTVIRVCIGGYVVFSAMCIFGTSAFLYDLSTKLQQINLLV